MLPPLDLRNVTRDSGRIWAHGPDPNTVTTVRVSSWVTTQATAAASAVGRLSHELRGGEREVEGDRGPEAKNRPCVCV